MSLGISNSYQQLLLSPHSRTHRKLLPLHHRRGWKRRKIKLSRSTQPVNLTIRSSFDSSAFENFFQNLISQFPSPNSLDILGPALGLASGAALYFSERNSKLISNWKTDRSKSVGEWILFSSPTPFNRFVILRCPSITFEDNDFLEDVNERLVKEDRHFVNLNRGKIQLRQGELEEEAEKLVYQRRCVVTEDGGVISFDWPANLDLEEERGLDTTMLIVPGTAEGSMDKEIKGFVCECLRRGYFPVVMNPRGCAGSPLTTPRLFTAADSDDVSTAMQFINKARPWTTMMSIGWGYGANMLTKYLAEVGERTPLTAATCIDNPFDLDEMTRSTPHCILLDQKLKTGLIDILRSNKELFQGRAKNFNVDKALLATSVRDFEKEISMVSYGFDEIEDFYAKACTRDMIGKVKIPLLFIQNNNGTVPLFSTPRSLIAENPFTSLLLCSYLPSGEFTRGRPPFSWCQQITIEWLTAVELGLLKGRHPLLKDVDVTITPSKGLTMLESSYSSKNGKKVNRLLNFPSFDAHSINNVKQSFEASYLAPNFPSKSKQESQGLQKEGKVLSGPSKDVYMDLVGEEMVNPIDGETGQVEQTARVIMNMLDVTMPDTLTEEMKKKVLTAVGRGESILKALQDAVPEDVRGKLTSAVSGILQNQDSSLKMDRLLGLGRLPEMTSKLKSTVQEKAGQSNVKSENENTPASTQTQMGDQTDGSKSQPHQNKFPVGSETKLQSSEYQQRSVQSAEHQSPSIFESDTPDSDKTTDGLESGKETMYSSKANQLLDSRENRSETSLHPEVPGRSEGPHVTDNKPIGQSKELDNEESLPGRGESMNQQNEVQTVENSADETKNVVSGQTEDTTITPVAASESQSMDKQGGDSLRREDNRPQSGSVDDPKLPSFNVSQALDALTGFDDSTQVAVNSVFNVLQDMITQLEEERDDTSRVEDITKRNEDRGPNTGHELNEKVEVQEQQIGPNSENNIISNNYKPGKLEDDKKSLNLPSATSRDANAFIQISFKEESARDTSLFYEGDADRSKNYMYEGDGRMKDSLSKKLSTENLVKYLNSIYHPGALSITTNLYVPPLYREYLQKYLVSKTWISKSLDLGSNLSLDYYPEEGKWKLLELSEKDSGISDDVSNHGESVHDDQTHLKAEDEGANEIIEPSYVILDSEVGEEQVDKSDRANETRKELDDDTSEELFLFVKSIMLDTLKVEVDRRLSATDVEEMQPRLGEDLELVANAVSRSVGHVEHTKLHKIKGYTSDKFGILEGLHIVNAISSAVQETSYLRNVLPVGVVVGSSLASLRRYFDVSVESLNSQKEGLDLDYTSETMPDVDQLDSEKMEQKQELNIVIQKCDTATETSSSNGNTLMVGAVTAALGASAFLVEQQSSGTSETLSKNLKDKGSHYENHKNEEKMPENSQHNVVTSLAEKALSVASPVVPTKEDGEVDQERLVAMLAELGQKGGALKLVGKVALLWGGIRGALSLTDKLISFLRMAERPLSHRIIGFGFMVIVLWSPVVVPFLPTLVQSWANHQSPRFAELVCLIGLYVSVLLMVTLWGKRIRGYGNPLEQYGLDLTSLSKVQNFAKGLLGGVALVSLINYVNHFCGFVQLSGPSYLLASSSNVVAWLKLSGRTLLLVFQGLVTATGIAVVQELLFRSWLPDEIAADLGYYRGVIISGLVFSLSQRSLWAIPGLWLLSLALAGARQRSQGSLSLSIGLHTGILSSSFILQRGGFLTYNPSRPVWLCGSRPFEPFSGLTGLAFSVLLVIILHPRQTLIVDEEIRTINSEPILKDGIKQE
ncbi:OLC1v1033780C1 [Oldenlandia corymbosa var. corymbosa]|uniref:OLC1v1033780C1 n=1 Tax=Oldenlandia corymbosa var. corymbosa TaxID=529605 RepID=A0AAV1CS81_OLDCO|nr:OLC1v1033780C1 [Oldenlandia corymbosa var. corymbosa]